MEAQDVLAPLRTMNVMEMRLLRRKEPLISEVVQMTRDVGRTAVRQGLLSEEELHSILLHVKNRQRMRHFLQTLENKGPSAYAKLCYLLDNLGHAWLCEHLLAELICEKSDVNVDANVRKQVELLVRQRLEQRARHLDVRDLEELVNVIATRYQARKITGTSSVNNKKPEVFPEGDPIRDSLDDIVFDVVGQFAPTGRLFSGLTPQNRLASANQKTGLYHVIGGVDVVSSDRLPSFVSGSQLVTSGDTLLTNHSDGSGHVTNRKAVTKKEVGKVKVTSFKGASKVKVMPTKGANKTCPKKPRQPVARTAESKVASKEQPTKPKEKTTNENPNSKKSHDSRNPNLKKSHDSHNPNPKKAEDSDKVHTRSRKHGRLDNTPRSEEEDIFAPFVWDPVPTNLPLTRLEVQKLRKKTHKENTRSSQFQSGPLAQGNEQSSSTGSMGSNDPQSSTEAANQHPSVQEKDDYTADDIVDDRGELDKTVRSLNLIKLVNMQADNTMVRGIDRVEEQYWQKRCDIIRRCKSIGYYNFLSEHKRERCDACSNHPNNSKDCVFGRPRPSSGRRRLKRSKNQPRKILPDATPIVPPVDESRLPPGDAPFKPAHAQCVRFKNNHQGESCSRAPFDDERCPGAFSSSVTRGRRCLACAYANEQVEDFYDGIVSSCGDHHFYFPYAKDLPTPSCKCGSNASVAVE